MHEFSIVQSLLGAAETEARRAGATKVTRMTCRIGTMRHVDDVLLREAFEMARADTICAECELVVEKTRMFARCPNCDVRFSVDNWDWACTACGAIGVDPSGGDELDLVSMEAEVPDGDHGT